MKMMSKLREKRAAAETMILTAILFLSNAMAVYATEVTEAAEAGGGISDSKLAMGTQQLIQDATTFLMVIAPIAAGMFIIYFCIRKSAADEMDQKKWNNRIVVAIVSCIGAVLGSATLNVIIGYYK